MMASRFPDGLGPGDALRLPMDTRIGQRCFCGDEADRIEHDGVVVGIAAYTGGAGYQALCARHRAIMDAALEVIREDHKEVK